MFVALKDYDPTIFWYKKSTKQLDFMTVGKRELSDKLNKLNIRGASYRRINEEYAIHRLPYREDISLDDYDLVDAPKYLVEKFATPNNNDIIAESFTVKFMDSSYGKFVCNIKPMDSFKKNLFFSANPKYRSSILNGKQPIRTNKYYTGIYNSTEEGNSKFDWSEGSERFIRFENVHVDLKEGGVLGLLSVSTTWPARYEFYCFSLHDENADMKKMRDTFGRDKFQIIYFNDFVRGIYEDVIKFHSKTSLNIFGAFVYFGKVSYKNRKELLLRNVRIEIPGNNLGPLRAELEKKYISEEDYFKHIPKDIMQYATYVCFEKNEEYEWQSEYRLVIAPIFMDRNTYELFFTLDPRDENNKDKEIIWLDGNSNYRNSIKLVQ